MLKIHTFILFVFVTTLCKAQVGIMTETPKTTFHIQKSLINNVNDINVSDGALPPIMTKQELANKAVGVYSSQQKGTIVYVDDISGGTSGLSTSQVIYINTPSFYFFDGKYWRTLQQSATPNAYSFYDIIDTEATKRVDFTPILLDPSSYYSLNENIDIGMSLNVTIPPETIFKVQITYSVPVGSIQNRLGYNGYYGVSVNKTDQNMVTVPVDQGSRKYTVSSQARSGKYAYELVTVSSTFSDMLTNTSKNPITYRYSFDGYIEISFFSASAPNIIFNMFSNPGAFNYNWGHSYASVMIFNKSIN